MELKEFFADCPQAALAFSGGTDSAFLLWAAAHYGCDVRAYYAKTAFQPAFELADARRLAAQLGVPLTVVEVDILANTAAQNPPDRCYYCKRALFEALQRRAAADGCSLLLDGTNASDNADGRPGMRALRELAVRSPLQECDISKAEVRRLSREAGLFTWDKPAYACLATRVPAGTPLTAELLQKIEKAEDALFRLGFTDFRVRTSPDGRTALLQLTEKQLPLLFQKRTAVLAALQQHFFAAALDLALRAPGL